MMGAACAKIICYGCAIVTSTVYKTSFQNSVSLKLHNLGGDYHSPQTPWRSVRKYSAYLRRRVYMNCTLGVMGAWGKSIVVVVVVAITINGVGTVS